MAKQDPTTGMLVIDPRFTATAEHSGSSYTEAGPQPGTPVPGTTGSPWRPQIVGAQSVDLDVQSIRGGFAGRDGAAIKWKPDTDGVLLWRGWDEPNLVTGFTAPSGEWSTFDFSVGALCTIPDTGEIVVYVDGTSGSHVFRYNPRSEEWTAGYDFAANSVGLQSTNVALVYDPARDQIILYTGEGDFDDDCVALASSDKGDTWRVFSFAYYDADNAAGNRLSIVPSSTAAWGAASGSGDLTQWVSLDSGITWQEVAEVSAAVHNDEFEMVPVQGGGFVLVYIEDTSQDLKARTLGSAQSLFSESTAVTIESGTFNTMAACMDEDGIIYLVAQEGANTDLRVWRSLDDGVTWEAYVYSCASDMFGNTGTADLRVVASAGSLFVLITENSNIWDSSLAAPFALLRLGGWSNVEADSGSASEGRRLGRAGYGANSYETDGSLWLPTKAPDTVGVWARTGNTIDLTNGPWGNVVTSSAQSYWTQNFTQANYMCGEFKVRVNSGGSTGSNAIALRARNANGVNDYQVEIRLTTTDIVAYDVHGASGTTQGGLDLTDPVYIRWHIADQYAFVAYRTEGSTAWSVIWEDQTLTVDTSTPGANSGVEWGHIASSTGDSDWFYVGYSPGGTWRYGVRTAAQAGLTITLNSGDPLGLNYGHPVPPRSVASYPIPGATTSSEDMGRIAAAGGPTFVSESTSIPASHQYPASAIYPGLSPSRAQYWESTDATEAIFAWDLGSILWTGNAWGLFVAGAYARQWALEYSTNGSSWTTAGTLDLSVSAGTALNATRAGNTFRPRSGITDQDEYWPEGSLVGGYVIADPAGTPEAFRISSNTGGYFTDDTDVQQVILEVEGDPSGIAASTSMDVIAPSGVLVVYPTSVTSRRYWRVRAAASQTTPGSVYRASVVGVGRIVGFGADHDWDWSRRLELQRSVTRRRDGTAIVEKTGDPRQDWSWAWSGGLVVRELRAKANGGAYPDSVGISGGLEIGSKEDTWSTLWGLLKGNLESGQMPCVLLPQLPTSTGSIIDPTLYHYGWFASDSNGITNVVGDEGEGEVVRLDGAVFEGL